VAARKDTFLSAVGTFIIVLSIGGFFYGMYETVILASVTIGLLSFVGLVFGVYNGYLGVVVGKAVSSQTEDQDMRGAIRDYQPSVRPQPSEIREARRGLLLSNGFSTEEIEKMGDLAEMTGEQFSQIIARWEYHHS